jgi:hypothetical protein
LAGGGSVAAACVEQQIIQRLPTMNLLWKPAASKHSFFLISLLVLPLLRSDIFIFSPLCQFPFQFF